VLQSCVTTAVNIFIVKPQARKSEKTNLEVKVDVHVLAEPAIDVAKLIFFAARAKTK
jgi:hypothetical protein